MSTVLEFKKEFKTPWDTVLNLPLNQFCQYTYYLTEEKL